MGWQDRLIVRDSKKVVIVRIDSKIHSWLTGMGKAYKIAPAKVASEIIQDAFDADKSKIRGRESTRVLHGNA